MKKGLRVNFRGEMYMEERLPGCNGCLARRRYEAHARFSSPLIILGARTRVDSYNSQGTSG